MTNSIIVCLSPAFFDLAEVSGNVKTAELQSISSGQTLATSLRSLSGWTEPPPSGLVSTLAQQRES